MLLASAKSVFLNCQESGTLEKYSDMTIKLCQSKVLSNKIKIERSPRAYDLYLEKDWNTRVIFCYVHSERSCPIWGLCQTLPKLFSHQVENRPWPMHAEMIVKNVSSQHKMASDQGRKYITSKTKPISNPTFRSQRCSTSTNFPLWQLSTWLDWHFTTIWEVLVIEPIRELEHDQCRSKRIQHLRGFIILKPSRASFVGTTWDKQAHPPFTASGENELCSCWYCHVFPNDSQVQYKSKMFKA